MLKPDLPAVSQRTLFFWGLFLAAVTGLYNIGIIALDDYTKEISTMIPAQLQAPIQSWVQHGEHFPYARIVLSSITRGLYALGVSDPIWQLRLCLLLLALVNYSITVFSMRELTREQPPLTQWYCSLLAGFYCISPLIFSRPMIESLGMPFLTASAYFAHSYWKSKETQQLLLALIVLAAGCLFRPQIGVVAPVILALPLLKRRYVDFAALLVAAVLSFVATGMADEILGKGFHGSLLKYIEYNRHAGEWHGVMPFYTFLLLLLGLSLPPALLGRYRGFRWRHTYASLLVPLLFFVAFVFAHSCFGHKEDRFMIPIIPLFLVLLSPLLAFWHQQRSYWRLGYFFGINAVLLIAIVTQVPQIAIIRLVQAVEGVPQIRRVISLEDSVALFPAAYGLRAREIEIARTTSEALLSDPTFKCDEPIVVRADKKQRVWAARPRFQVVQTLSPGWIEQILVKTNPGRNLRRGPLEIWLPADCPNPF